MTLKEVFGKVAKGEPLTDAEKAFLAGVDPEKERDEAAAAARRKAEGERDTLKAQLDKLTADAAEVKRLADEKAAAGMTESQKQTAALAALSAQVAALTKGKEDAEARVNQANRSQAIREKAKAAGIILAPKTVNEGLFNQLMEAHLAGVDVADETALKTALERFKAENAGIIQAPGSGAGFKPGEPGVIPSGKNPFHKDSFNLTEQVELVNRDPAAAKALAEQAGVKID